MIEDELSHIFSKNGWKWRLKGGNEVVPSADDIEAALDEAARVLYTEPVGTQLEVGRLIIKKQPRGYDVYVYVDQYD